MIQKRKRDNRWNVCTKTPGREEAREALGCADLQQAFDTVPREMIMATVGVSEAGVRMVEAMYERTTRRTVVGPGMMSFRLTSV